MMLNDLGNYRLPEENNILKGRFMLVNLRLLCSLQLQACSLTLAVACEKISEDP